MLQVEKAVVILSGGLDSGTLVHDIVSQYGAENVHAISFDYGQKHSCELVCASKICAKLGIYHEVFSLDVLNQIAPSALTRKDWEVPAGHYTQENMSETVVKNRNMVMLSLAASYAMSKGITNLYYGAHSGDHCIYFDCRKEFIDAMAKVLSLADEVAIKLHVPYWNLNKIAILEKGLKLGVDYSLTHTCYNPNEKGESCGVCGSCSERLEAFEKNGVKDPLKYYN